MLWAKTLVLCLALPVLAEASVLLVGAMRLPWLAFFVPVSPANLGIALAYSLLRRVIQPTAALLLWAVGAVALPLLATESCATVSELPMTILRTQRQSEMKTGTGKQASA